MAVILETDSVLVLPGNPYIKGSAVRLLNVTSLAAANCVAAAHPFGALGLEARTPQEIPRFFAVKILVLVSDTVSQQDPDQFGARPNPQLPVDSREMRLDCLAGDKQGCCYLVIVLPSCGNSGSL